MKATKRLTNNAGFSLIELMVVVAIIGVLASIAVPSVSKYMAKAKQSEAKSNLASYYVSQKAFLAEYNSYDSRFGAIGYSPEGKLLYLLGTSSAFTAPPANYTLPTGANTAVNTGAFCGAAPTFTNGCAQMPGGAIPATAGVMTQSTFTAGAGGQIRPGAAVDWWTMDHNKRLLNTQDGTM